MKKKDGPIAWIQYVAVRIAIFVFHMFPVNMNLQTARLFGRICYAVAVMANGKNTGVIFETGLCEDIQRPQGPAGDGIAGCPVPPHGSLGQVLQDALGAQCFFAKLLDALFIDELVAISVTSDLVSAVGDLANQVRRPVRHPAKNKKSGLCFVFVEKVHESPGIVLDAHGNATPLRPLNTFSECRVVKIILNVDCQGI